MFIQKGDAAFIQASARLIDEYEKKLRSERRYFPRLTRRKISNEAMMNYMLFMIENSLSWKALHRCIDGFHYQSVFKRFQTWVKHGVFQYIWNELLQEYSRQKLSNNPNHFMNLFTDTTMIKSLEGADCIGRNPTDRGRNGTKVSVIIDEDKVAISKPLMFPANTSDIKTLVPTLCALLLLRSSRRIPFITRIDRRRTTRIAADKAYRKKGLAANLLKMKIRLVTEPKRNEVNPILMRQKDKAFYRKRIYIEHFFGMIKKGNKRIRFRVDRKIATYNALWFLAMARRTFNAINK